MNLLKAAIRSPVTSYTALVAFAILVLQAVQALIDGDPSTNPDWNVVVEAFLALGLFAARDANKTSEESRRV